MRQLKITPQITSRDSISVNKYLQEISTIPMITQEEEIELSKKIQEGDEKALDKFVKSNLRFVISVSKQYQGLIGTNQLGDLISAGNEGLIMAAKRFDPSRGFKFISYAVWWIRQSILQFINENGKSIRLPANKVNLINKIRTVIAALEQELHRNPTMEEVSEELERQGKNIDVETLELTLLCSVPVTSLDMKIGNDTGDDISLLDLIQGEGDYDVTESLLSNDLNTVLMRLFDKKLSPQEKKIVISYFGLFGTISKSLEELGLELELTRERVRQIKEKAIKKLKRPETSKQIKEYV